MMGVLSPVRLVSASSYLDAILLFFLVEAIIIPFSGVFQKKEYSIYNCRFVVCVEEGEFRILLCHQLEPLPLGIHFTWESLYVDISSCMSQDLSEANKNNI